MNTFSEAAREIEVKGEYDVIVVGGGPAGVGASLAAARAGKSVLVIEQFNCLGGVATAGGHGHISKYDETNTGRRIVGGIAQEIREALIAEGYGMGGSHGVWFEVEGLKLILDRMARKAGVDVLYHTFFCESIVEDGVIKGVIIQNKTGRQAVYGKRVIDCTGDGDVGYSAGCPYEIGRPSDSKCQPVTLMFTIGGVDWERVEEFKRDYKKQYPEDNVWWKLEGVYKKAIENGDMRPFQTGNMGWWWTNTRPDWVGVNFTHVIYIDTTKAEDLTRATMEGREQCYETIEVYRKYIPGMENCYMISTPNTVGLRESRRIMGEYIMNENEVKGQATYDDAIAYGSFFVDIHCIDGPGMDPTIWRPGSGFKYQIPYRILVPQKVDNLMVAGRCVSCTHVALGSLRVMVPCIAEGEAAGIASAISIDDGVMPRAVDVIKLQRRIVENGGILSEADIVRYHEVEAVAV
ncbi:MAG: FAD-dependent oxidoreductase [Planctomycetes bacterium]|nr:FAD-dependent oxidoreductase [Planctomycetota bacterium]